VITNKPDDTNAERATTQREDAGTAGGTLLDEILEANHKAVNSAGDKGTFVANRHLCIVTCVDPRLTRFFGFALGVERGHAVAIRVPGARIPPDSYILRALAATVYVNDCQEVLVLAHTDCGVARLRGPDVEAAMARRGVSRDTVAGPVDQFFGLVDDLRHATDETVRTIRQAPFLPRMPVHSGIIDVATGELTLWERGY
jgi:carbonic anhydrase